MILYTPWRVFVALKLNETSGLTKAGDNNHLDPFIDDYGLLRVGERLKRSVLQINIKHTVTFKEASSS